MTVLHVAQRINQPISLFKVHGVSVLRMDLFSVGQPSAPARISLVLPDKYGAATRKTVFNPGSAILNANSVNELRGLVHEAENDGLQFTQTEFIFPAPTALFAASFIPRTNSDSVEEVMHDPEVLLDFANRMSRTGSKQTFGNLLRTTLPTVILPTSRRSSAFRIVGFKTTSWEGIRYSHNYHHEAQARISMELGLNGLPTNTSHNNMYHDAIWRGDSLQIIPYASEDPFNSSYYRAPELFLTTLFKGAIKVTTAEPEWRDD